MVKFNLVKLDVLFRQTLGEKYVINLLNTESDKTKNDILNRTKTILDFNVEIDSTPQCECGETVGSFRTGVTCVHCSTKVTDYIEKTNPNIWFKSLDNSLPLINPYVYMIISKNISTGTDYLPHFINPRHYKTIKKPPPPYISACIEEYMGGRDNVSYRKFIANIENIITYIAKKKHKPKLLEVLELYQNQKDIIYNEYVPLINSTLFVVEKTNKGQFVNLILGSAIDAVDSWFKTINRLKVISSNETLTDETRKNKILDRSDQATGHLVSTLGFIIAKLVNDNLARKTGMIRKHIYGFRSHFTFRSVITSMYGPHKKDDVLIPWAAMIVCFRLHLINMLYKTGNYTIKSAGELLNNSLTTYSPLLHQLFREMLKSRKELKLPILVQRNPSLSQGSFMLLDITDVKSNVYDKTLSLSQQIVGIYNGDYDGDALNCSILVSNLLIRLAQPFRSWFNIHDNQTPFKLHPKITITRSGEHILNNWVNTKDENIKRTLDIFLKRGIIKNG